MTDPVLVFDDECGFCTWSADLIGAHSPTRIVGFSTQSPERRERLPANFERCVHLVTKERVYSCGEAVEAAIVRLDFVPAGLQQPGPIRQSRSYEWLRERVYRWVAKNRSSLGRIVSKSPRGSDGSEPKTD